MLTLVRSSGRPRRRSLLRRLPPVPPRPRPSGDTVLEVTGDLDLATVPALDERVDRALSGAPACLTLDLSGLTFTDACGLRALLRARDRARCCGCGLVLLRPSPPVRRLLALTGLSGEFCTAELPPPRACR